jgi:NAD(P)-dependent dehydrogenase (short-subunit alcohol dehydrogenase family)
LGGLHEGELTEMDSRVVLVTGGTFGIGAGISVELARRGWRVVAFGLDAPQPSSIAQDGSRALREELSSNGLDADILDADVSNAPAVQKVVDHALGRYGHIDALVNNAAIGPLGSVLQTAEDIWDRVIDVNLKGIYLCCRAVLPHMIERGGGAIVNVGSGAGWGKPNMAAYAASKGGVHALTMALAYDHFDDHIRVNGVIPGGGGIATGMSLGRLGGDQAMHAAKKVMGTVAGRRATGTDIAKAVAFLLSDDAAVISGTIVDVGCFAHQGGRG